MKSAADEHMHEGKLTIIDANHISVERHDKGKPVGAHEFDLVRRNGAPSEPQRETTARLRLQGPARISRNHRGHLHRAAPTPRSGMPGSTRDLSPQRLCAQCAA